MLSSVTGLEPLKLMIRARTLLLNKMPFWGTLAMQLRLVESPNARTTGVTKDFTLHYNPEWVNKFSLNDAIFEFAHEVMHLVQRLHDRTPKGVHYPTWNYAADIVCDAALDEAKLPRSWCSNEMITAEQLKLGKELKLTERVYEYLMKNQPPRIQNCPQCQKELNGTGGNADDGNESAQGENDSNGNGNDSGNGSGKNGDKLAGTTTKGHTCGARCEQDHSALKPDDKAKLVQSITVALSMAKSRGSSPGSIIEHYISELSTSHIDWKSYVRTALMYTFRGRYTYAKPHRRCIDRGFVYPSRGPEVGGIVAILDCSGSISSILPILMGEMHGLCVQSGCDKIYVIQHDVNVFNAGLYDAEGLKKLKPTFGGTCHKEAFKVVEGEHPKYKIPFKPQLVVALTDLESSFPENCSVKTLWVTDDRRRVVPFGQKVVFNRGDYK